MVRNIVAASVFGILARVSSRYLQALACEFLFEEAREDGEPIATPSTEKVDWLWRFQVTSKANLFVG